MGNRTVRVNGEDAPSRLVSRSSSLTQCQFRALRIEKAIHLRLGRVNRDFLAIGKYLSTFKREFLADELDYANFGEWVGTLDLSPSLAYDLVAIWESRHQSVLATLSISHARLLLPHCKPETAPEHVAELADDIRDLTWNDARQRLNGDDPAPVWHYATCPKCRAKLKLGKATSLELA